MERGDIEASLTDPTGLFSFDTRFLSRWVLTVDDQRLSPLSVDDLQYFETRFFLVPGTGTVYVDAKLSVIRHRSVANGFHEELTILNHDDRPVQLVVRLEAGCDFADLFEVKDAVDKKGAYATRVDDRRLVLTYRREKRGVEATQEVIAANLEYNAEASRYYHVNGSIHATMKMLDLSPWDAHHRELFILARRNPELWRELTATYQGLKVTQAKGAAPTHPDLLMELATRLRDAKL